VSISQKKTIGSILGHEKRIKDLSVVIKSEDDKWLVSGSNDGMIKVWKIKLDSDALKCEGELLCEVNSGVRISCMCSYVRTRNQKRKKDAKNEVKVQQTDSMKISVEDSETSAKKVKFAE
jgi:WD40 repeat protein